MTQPPGFEVPDRTIVCKLEKALYGAPRVWFEKLATTLFKFGFNQSKCDSSQAPHLLLSLILNIYCTRNLLSRI